MADYQTKRAYSNYAEFKSAWEAEYTVTDLKQGMDKIPSLAKFLGQEGVPIGTKERLADLASFKTQLTQEFFAMKSRIEKSLASGAPVSQELNAQIADYLAHVNGLSANFESGKLTAIGKRFTDILNLMPAGKTIGAEEGTVIRQLLGKAVQPAITVIGDIAENQMREALTNKEIQQEFADQAVVEALNSIKNVQKGSGVKSGLRSEINYSANLSKRQSVDFSRRAGTELTDIQFDMNAKGQEAKYRISVKQSASSSENKTLRAATLPFGAYMSTIPGKDSYYWWTFLRVLGRTSGRTQASREIKAYLARRNLKDALLGSGLDQIGDFIINGRLYSAEYFVDKLVEMVNNDLNTAIQVLKLQANLQVDGNESADDAVQHYIDSKYAAKMLGVSTILTVGIPDL